MTYTRDPKATVSCFFEDDTMPFYVYDHQDGMDHNAYKLALVRRSNPGRLEPGQWVHYEHQYWVIVQMLNDGKILIGGYEETMSPNGWPVALVVTWDDVELSHPHVVTGLTLNLHRSFFGDSVYPHEAEEADE